MQQPQRLFEHGQAVACVLRCERRFLFGSDIGFREFDIPVAKIVPEEVIERLYRLMKLVRVDRSIQILRGFV